MYNGDEVRNRFEYSLNDWRKEEVCLTHIKSINEFSLFNPSQMKSQMSIWRKDAKAGKLKIMRYNNKTKTIKGKEYYTLVVQPYKNEKMCDCEMDVMGLFGVGEMVSGYMYMFNNVKNRDMTYEYVMKGVSEPTGGKNVFGTEESGDEEK